MKDIEAEARKLLAAECEGALAESIIAHLTVRSDEVPVYKALRAILTALSLNREGPTDRDLNEERMDRYQFGTVEGPSSLPRVSIADETENALDDLVMSLNALIEESEGVYGLHLNGDPAPWSELLSGGRFEEWLGPALDRACKVRDDALASPSSPPEDANAPLRAGELERARRAIVRCLADETSETITEWVKGAFGGSDSAFRRVARGNEEMAELITAVASDAPPEKIGEEAADVAILLHLICGRLGLDLDEQIAAKMATNRTREWRVDDTGCGYHIKDAALSSTPTPTDGEDGR